MARRRFTKQFKDSSVEMVLKKGYSVHLAAKELGIDHKTLRAWVQSHKAGGGDGPDGVREELHRLRRENARLRMERDILKKATAFFARERA